MGTKVLIVDDAAFMRMMLRDILAKNGFDVVGEADNGKVAVQRQQPRDDGELSSGGSGSHMSNQGRQVADRKSVV